MKKKRVIVFGKGKWGKIFISRLKSKVKIVKILRSKDNFKNINYKNIDWIFILTSTNKHFEICNYFIKKCKNIFCEKPLTFDLSQSKELLKKAKKFKCNLYVSDVEKFKEKKIKLKKNNTIIRKKFSDDKHDLLFRYAYHDLYTLSGLISIKKFRSFKLIKNEIGLISYSFRVQNILLKFTYSFNSKQKVHKINNCNFLLFKGNPLDQMIERVILNKENIIENNKNALNAIYVINKIKKNFLGYD